ncbi:NAD(+) diphosphatase [Phycicoccus sonneratiae]|uniref:NAD(+) diphosphatase n=1 Tax=Phycicoccus sonneratiae TaxID=2807628 RepID=A0ABS2CLG6_9MICO|nr:NAD(+) diphosphatase [Phycicoccus sonneraticus]MBM6400729.1 NAD(+) diphosphatase [Phycicoccus sonneraticus]
MARADHLLPDVALTRQVLDRRADLRTDPALLTRLLADPTTRVFRLRGDAAEVLDAGDGGLRVRLGPPEPVDADHLVVYLGEAGGTHHLGVAEDLPEGAVAPEGLRTLRQAGARLDDLGAAIFVTTLALANWHRSHGYCPRCGRPTVPVLAGWVRHCRADDSEHYPRTDMAVIMAVVDADDRILLARGKGFRGNGMSVLAGFVEPGETLAAAVAREVAEEVGVEVTDVTYLGDQPWPFPTSLMLGFTARALSTELTLQDTEIEAARWFTRDELAAAVADGSLAVSGRVSISRRLLEHWYGGPAEAPDVALR